MPWCDECDRLVDDDELDETRCPTCGTEIVDGPRGPLPWRFRLMIVATVIYLGYRLYQGIAWVAHR